MARFTTPASWRPSAASLTALGLAEYEKPEAGGRLPITTKTPFTPPSDAVSIALGFTEPTRPAPEPVENPEGTALGRGFRTGVRQLGAITGGGAAALGDVLDDTRYDWLDTAANELKEWGVANYNAYSESASAIAGDVPSAAEVFSKEGKFSDFLAWAGHHAGSGAATAIPAFVTGAIAAVSAPVSAVASAAVLYGMGVGDIYGAQLDQQEDPDVRWALGGGVPYAVAEKLFGVGAQAAKMLTGASKRKMQESLLGSVRRAARDGMLGEAGAESVQTILTEAIPRLENGEELGEVLSSRELWAQVAEGAAAGAVGGATLGPAGALRRRQPEPEEPAGTVEETPFDTAETEDIARATMREEGVPESQVEQNLETARTVGAQDIAQAEVEAAQPHSEAEAAAAPVAPSRKPTSIPVVDPETGAGGELQSDLVEEGLRMMDDLTLGQQRPEAASRAQELGLPQLGRTVRVKEAGVPEYTGRIADVQDADGDTLIEIETDEADGGSYTRQVLFSEDPVILPVRNPQEQAEIEKEEAESVKRVEKQREDEEKARQEAVQEEQAAAQATIDMDALINQQDGLLPVESQARAEEVAQEQYARPRQDVVADPETRDTFLKMVKTDLKTAADQRKADEQVAAEEAQAAEQSESERVQAEQESVQDQDDRMLWEERVSGIEEQASDVLSEKEQTEIGASVLESMGLNEAPDQAATPERRKAFADLLETRVKQAIGRKEKEVSAFRETLLDKDLEKSEIDKQVRAFQRQQREAAKTAPEPDQEPTPDAIAAIEEEQDARDVEDTQAQVAPEETTAAPVEDYADLPDAEGIIQQLEDAGIATRGEPGFDEVMGDVQDAIDFARMDAEEAALGLGEEFNEDEWRKGFKFDVAEWKAQGVRERKPSKAARDVMSNPETAKRVHEIVNRIAPTAMVRTREKLPGGQQGRFTERATRDIVEVVLDKDAEVTANHEAFHAVWNLIDDKEMSALKAAAKKGGWMEKHKIADRYKDEAAEVQLEEAFAEEFASWAKGVNGRPLTVSRIFKKIMDALRTIANALRGKGVAVKADDVFQRVKAGKVGKRSTDARTATPRPKARRQRARKQYAPKDIYKSSPEYAERMETMLKGVPAKPEDSLSGIKQVYDDVVKSFRVYRHIPNVAKWARARTQFRRMQASSSVAVQETGDMLKTVFDGLNQQDRDMINQHIMLEDNAWNRKQGMKIPGFGNDYAAFDKAKAEFDAAWKGHPEHNDLRRRAAAYKAFTRKTARDMIRVGLLTEEQSANPAYFHNMVLDYAMEEEGIGVYSPSGVKKPTVHERKGTERLINANVAQVAARFWVKQKVAVANKEAVDALNKAYGKRDEIEAKIHAHNAAFKANLKGNPEIADLHKQAMQGEKASLDALRAAKVDSQSIVMRHKEAFERVMSGERITSKEQNAVHDMMAFLSLNGDGPTIDIARRYMAARQTAEDAERMAMPDGKPWINPRDIDGAMAALGIEGHAAWSWDNAKPGFTVLAPSEAILAKIEALRAADILGDNPKDIDPKVFDEVLGSIQEYRQMAGHLPQYVLPQEIAAQLDDVGKPLSDNIVARNWRGLLSWSKMWMLINPLALMRYTVTNMSGDSSSVLASGFERETVGQIKQAAKDAFAISVQGKQAGKEYVDLIRRGIVDADFVKQEVHDIGEHGIEFAEAKRIANEEFAAVLKDLPKVTPSALIAAWRKTRTGLPLMRWLAQLNASRENIMRIGLYRGIVKKAKAFEADFRKAEGKAPTIKDIFDVIGYGAGTYSEVQGQESIEDAAARIVRDTIGDYAAVSRHTDFMRRYVMPFYSWNEVNTKMHLNIIRNIAYLARARSEVTERNPELVKKYGSKLWRGAALGVGAKAAGFAALNAMKFAFFFEAWNALFGGEEEEEIRRSNRSNPHLILPFGNKDLIWLLRAPGTLTDFMSWIPGINNRGDYADVLRGQLSLDKALAESVKIPVNRMANSLWWYQKLPFELISGQKAYPDVFKMRPIKDPLRHAASGLGRPGTVIYDLVTGAPQQPLNQQAAQLLLKRLPRKQNAYYEIKAKVYEWDSDRTGSTMSMTGRSKYTKAMYNYGNAIRFGDRDAEKKFMRELLILGRTPKDLLRVIGNMHPLHPIPKKYRRVFLATLDTELERRQFRMAIQHFNEVAGPAKARLGGR